MRPVLCMQSSTVTPATQPRDRGAKKRALLLLLAACVPLLGLLDHAAALELDVGVLFLVPVLLAANLGGRGVGLAMAAGCGATTTAVELLHGGRLVHPLSPWWNGVAGFLVLGAAAWLATGLRDAAAREHAAARSDPLTQVANRRLFLERLQGAIDLACDGGKPLTVAYLDCDEFKKVNDERGHQEGDRVLQAIAELLQANVRRDDTVARLGGDEFALLLPQTGEADARTTVERALRALADDPSAPAQVRVSLSAGVATFRGRWSVDEVLVRADRLLAEAKRGGKSRAEFCSFS